MRKLSVKVTRRQARWTQKFWKKKRRYRGAKGGRSSGKSHEMAAQLVENMVADKDYSVVCIREIQKSLKYSAKRLIEGKIRSMGVGHLFKIQAGEIKRKYGTGICIFQGMQDHNADSIKSLEDFDLAWVEEAQSLSQRSLDLLIPTIRKDGSEIWFSWNPDQPTDPVDVFFAGNPADSICTHVNFTDNPFCPENVKQLAADWKRRRPDTYDHVWCGQYNTKSDDQVLNGCWREDVFDIDPSWDGPYFGADWGFSVDPSTLIGVYMDMSAVEQDPAARPTIYIVHERYAHGIEIVDYPEFFNGVPECKNREIRGDNARPEIISHIKKSPGYNKMRAAGKWPGSVEDGISWLRGVEEIVIHSSCTHTVDEARLWKYKRDRLTNEVLPVLIKGNDHTWDAVRYALDELIQQGNNMAQLLKMAMGKS